MTCVMENWKHIAINNTFNTYKTGSFTSSHKIVNEDTADNDLDLPPKMTWQELKALCEEELAFHPPRINRPFQKIHHLDGDEAKSLNIRVMQWNVLSQTLALGCDKFAACPVEALSWCTRRWRIVEEIISVQPDILCLQEVDHFRFFEKTLNPLGFKGIFFPKPDSLCYYIVGNNGPDGCAIFFNESKFELLQTFTRSLEVWGYQSNQVAILCSFRRKEDKAEFLVATTHLKARQGALVSTMRHEQGKDLLDFINLNNPSNKPVILTGDFNAVPKEPIYRVVMNQTEKFHYDSAYRHISNKLQEPPYTTWKIREDGEYCQTLDYIFFNKDRVNLRAVLSLPTETDIGPNKVPSFTYPSDHFSLVADFTLIPKT